MPNILLTNKCTRNCPYCFAGGEMAQSHTNDYLSWENAIYLADFLRASSVRHVSLLGGEPTLHPEFADLLLYFLERGFRVTVFTNGVMPEAKLVELKKHVARYSAERIYFVCNVNNPEQTRTPKAESDRQHAFLAQLGQWTMPGFNIYSLDFDLQFLFDLFDHHGLIDRLRLGIAHPSPGSTNDFIQSHDIGSVIARIYSYRRLFEERRIKPFFDCGFPLCRFNDEQLGWFYRQTGRLDFKCGPAIDITPDMKVYFCFPLSSLNKKSLFEFDSFTGLMHHYKDMQEWIRSKRSGIYRECASCYHRTEGMCSGGGACQMVSQFPDEFLTEFSNIEKCTP